MNKIVQEIQETVDQAIPLLSALPAEEVSSKPDPGKWSRKEMLGHLLDSAANNHQRIVRAAYSAAEGLPGYDQNQWVAIQHYQKLEWAELVQFWKSYNRHLCHVIDHLPPEALSARCGIGGDRPVTLEYVIMDYLRHLRHHLERLL